MTSETIQSLRAMIRRWEGDCFMSRREIDQMAALVDCMAEVEIFDSTAKLSVVCIDRGKWEALLKAHGVMW